MFERPDYNTPFWRKLEEKEELLLKRLDSLLDNVVVNKAYELCCKLEDKVNSFKFDMNFKTNKTITKDVTEEKKDLFS